MIHPLVPFAIRGAIWYQGESNNGDGMMYHEKMKALIVGWRDVWGQRVSPSTSCSLRRTDTATILPGWLDLGGAARRRSALPQHRHGRHDRHRRT